MSDSGSARICRGGGYMKETDRPTDRPTDRRADRQTDPQTDRQTDRQTLANQQIKPLARYLHADRERVAGTGGAYLVHCVLAVGEQQRHAQQTPVGDLSGGHGRGLVYIA